MLRGDQRPGGRDRRAARRLPEAEGRRLDALRLLDLLRRLRDGVNQAARKQAALGAELRRAGVGAGRGPRTAASSTTAPRPTRTASPWSERKKYVWWDEQAKWTGLDVPDFEETSRRTTCRRTARRRRRRSPATTRSSCRRTAAAGSSSRRGSRTGRCRRTTSRTSRRSTTRSTRSARTRRGSRSSELGGPVQPVPGEPAERLPVRRHDLPADRAPHGRRDVALGAVSRRAAARDVLRGVAGARRGSAASSTAAGRRSYTARSAIEARVLVTEPHPRRSTIDGRSDAPGRAAVPLGQRGL